MKKKQKLGWKRIAALCMAVLIAFVPISGERSDVSAKETLTSEVSGFSESVGAGVDSDTPAGTEGELNTPAREEENSGTGEGTVTPPTIGDIGYKGMHFDEKHYWINTENKNSCKIIIPVNNPVEGMSCTYSYKKANETDKTVVYSDTISVLSVESGKASFEIPFTENCLSTTLYYTVKDAKGNVIKDAEKTTTDVLADFTAPDVSVRFYDAAGTELTTPDNWQTGEITVCVEASDENKQEDLEEISGLDYERLEICDNETSITSDSIRFDFDGKYQFPLSEDGVHNLSVTVYDKAGNCKVVDKTVKIDKNGIQDVSVKLSTAPDLEDAWQFGGEFTVYAAAESKSGIREMTFSFYDRDTDRLLSQQAVTGELIQNNGDIYTAQYQFPLEEQEELNGYVVVQFVDNTVQGVPATENRHTVNSEKKEFAFNKNGAAISILGNTGWTNGDVRLQVHVSSTATTITRVLYYVNGNEVKSVEVNGFEYSDSEFILKDTSPFGGTQVEVVAICGANENSSVRTRGAIIVGIDKQAPALTLSGILDGATYNSSQILQITTVENIWNHMEPVRITATRTLDGVITSMDLGSYSVDMERHVAGRTFTEEGVYHVTATATDAAGNTNTSEISFIIDKTAPVISISGASEGAYSSQPVTLQFQSVESFFEMNRVQINVERRLGGSAYGRTISFTNTGRISSLSNTFSEDGDYIVTMTATDGAGNVAEVQTLSFTVDCTAPVITLSGTKDYVVTSRGISLNFSVIESYFDTNQVEIRGSRRLANGRTEALQIPGWNNTGRTSSLSREFTEDGYYTIIITATDKAGNSKEQTIHFTIDTEPPVIRDLSQYNGRYLSEFRLQESLEDLISELSVPTVRMTLNGEAYNGSEITAEGKYTLVIEVTDEVGLTSAESIEFVIDRTAPRVIISGVENRKTYTDAVRLNLSLENERDTFLGIWINGTPYALTEGQTAYDLVFNEYGDYEIVINTIDEAGNENSQTVSFTYAEYRNRTWLWISVGAAAVAAGLAIAFGIRRRKR